MSPVIIIGAPRSGTNMLRDVLTSFPGMATWPCDEINYIWRHGNVRYPSDQLPSDLVTARIQRYLRRQFDWVATRYDADCVVEKTCANSLRVAFVDRVVPGAKYIFIRRDGLDAVGSAMKRWTAEMDWPYILRKARFVPVIDLPYYGSRYLWNRMYRLFSRESRLAFWGPKLDGMDAILEHHTLEEVCALQWQRCVERSSATFAQMPDDKYLEVSYEDFVRSPQHELERILTFLNRDVPEEQIAQAVADVSARSLGRGREGLGKESVERLGAMVGSTLQRYGYGSA